MENEPSKKLVAKIPLFGYYPTRSVRKRGWGSNLFPQPFTLVRAMGIGLSIILV